MARGRLVSRTLGSSRKFAALRDRAGKLGEFAQLLFPMLVACSDDFGRMAGDAFTVKLTVFPSSPRPESDFATALKALHNVRLIHLYDADGDQVLEIVDFKEHQPGLSKRTSSKFPGPPVNFTEIQEIPAQEKGREEKGREGNRTEPIRSPQNPGTAQDEDRNEGVGAFIKRFCEVYARYRNGARYFIKREKHVPLIRALLKTYQPERLEKLAIVLLMTDDDWVQGTDRGIEILSVKASWLDNRLSEYEAKHGPVKVSA